MKLLKYIYYLPPQTRPWYDYLVKALAHHHFPIRPYSLFLGRPLADPPSHTLYPAELSQITSGAFNGEPWLGGSLILVVGGSGGV